MKCLILAAGYATRLYPLTENFPKPLLKVQGKPILDWLLEDLSQAGRIDAYAVVTNHKFARHFSAWAGEHRLPITVLDDGTESNETRLGAVRDIKFALDHLGWMDDLLVMAGDNLLDFSLEPFLAYQCEKGTSCIMRYWEADENRLHRSGVCEVDGDGRVLSMEEKPAAPRSHWCTPAFYILRAEDAGSVSRAIESGCGADAPGSFIAWLTKQTAVYAWPMPGERYDIGNLESYELAQKNYRGIRL